MGSMALGVGGGLLGGMLLGEALEGGGHGTVVENNYYDSGNNFDGNDFGGGFDDGGGF